MVAMKASFVALYATRVTFTAFVVGRDQAAWDGRLGEGPECPALVDEGRRHRRN
jgi:hypothetical protein